MKKLHLIYIFALFAGLLTSSCRDDELSPRLPGEEGDTLSRTLIVYMAAENSLYPYLADPSSAPFQLTDSAEIAKGLEDIPEDARVVLFIDDNKSSRLCVGTRKDRLQTVKLYDQNLCSTDGATMSAILDDIFYYYPARSYGLVLCSHGSGWLFDDPGTPLSAPRRNSFGIDNGNRSDSNHGRRMSIPMLASVLNQCPHMDFVMFDACFMQCVEVAYELRQATDYIIASPAEIPANGAPYIPLLRTMCSAPTNIKDIVNIYADYYLTGAGAQGYGGVELSVVHTEQLERLAQATAPLMRQLLAGGKELATDGVQRYYQDLSSSYFTGFFDLKNLLYKHLDAETYQAWVQIYDEAVPVQSLASQWYSDYDPWQSGEGTKMYIRDPEHTGGMSVYVPRAYHRTNGWLNNYHQLQWYQDTGMSVTNW